jgi:hypothetical protein
MAAKKSQTKGSDRTTTATAIANSISTTLLGSMTNMGVMATSSGSVLLCLYAAKRLI